MILRLKLSFLLASITAFSGTASAKVVDKIVAIANDQIVTLSDVEKFAKKLQGGGLMDDALLKLVDVEALKKDKTAVLNELVDERLIDSEVKRKNMEVTIERVEQEIRSIATNNNITRAQLEAALKGRGVSVSEYQDFIKTSLERQSLIEREVSSKIRISDEDISSYYLAKKGPTATQIFEYTLNHILFANKNGGDEGAMKRARLVLEKIKAGESFDSLAEHYSEDPAFTKGGLLGTFKAGEMTKELEQAVRQTPPGETTGIIKNRTGFQIIKVTKRTLIADPKLEEQREEIRRQLYGDAFKRQFRLWLAQRRDEAFIRINGL